MSKHTPGPWHHNIDDASNNPDICVTNRSGDILCDIGGGQFETRLANARLIAAAPDLLEALKEMVSGLLANASLGLNDEEVGRLKRAEAAIAKAEGK